MKVVRIASRRPAVWLAFLVLLPNLSAIAAPANRLEPVGTIVIDDPLQGSRRGELVGGRLVREGYMPGIGQNHILYRLPRPVTAGFAEFEVYGMDSAQVPADGDHGFIAMYDGRGVIEPAQYFRDFRVVAFDSPSR